VLNIDRRLWIELTLHHRIQGRKNQHVRRSLEQAQKIFKFVPFLCILQQHQKSVHHVKSCYYCILVPHLCVSIDLVYRYAGILGSQNLVKRLPRMDVLPDAGGPYSWIRSFTESNFQSSTAAGTTAKILSRQTRGRKLARSAPFLAPYL
jgi:hypothetical protein